MLFVREQEEILIINVGQHGCTLQFFQNALPPLLIYIKLHSLGISISLENKSTSGLRLPLTHRHPHLCIIYSMLTRGS